MPTNNRMYELEYPSPSSLGESPEGPTLVVALQGYADAGHAVEGVSNHLNAALETRTLATFNNDELIDYRSRRPAVTLANHTVADVEEIGIELRVVRDTKDMPFLLLSGPEPDLRWEAFSKSVADLAVQFGVQQTLCLYAAPVAAPHTRPVVVSTHGNDESLVKDKYLFDGIITVPGAASIMIERELDKRGEKVAGFTAHVPHYIANSPYPMAAFQLMQALEDTANLQLPLRALEQEITSVQRQLAEQTAASKEIAQVVSALEQHYDREVEEYRRNNPNAKMPGEAQVPSGDEISEAFENYLTAIEDQQSRPLVDGQRGLPFGDDLSQALQDFYYIDPAQPNDEEDE